MILKICFVLLIFYDIIELKYDYSKRCFELQGKVTYIFRNDNIQLIRKIINQVFSQFCNILHEIRNIH